MNLQESLNNFEAILESDRYAREQAKKLQRNLDTDKRYIKAGYDDGNDIARSSMDKIKLTTKERNDGTRGSFNAGDARRNYAINSTSVRKGSVVDTGASNKKYGEYSLRDFSKKPDNNTNDIHDKINARTKAAAARTHHEAVEELGRFVADIAKLYECGQCAENDQLVSEVLDEAANILMDVE